MASSPQLSATAASAGRPSIVPAENFGFLGSIFGAGQPASSALARERFGWQPTHPSLLQDLEAGNYPD